MLSSIIIPFLDKWELMHQRLAEIRRFAPEDCELILVNDGSTGSYNSQIRWWKTDGSRHPITYVENEKNLGFGGAMNAGADNAQGDMLFFLSNDVVIYSDFVEPTIETSEYHGHSCLLGAELLSHDTGWNKIGNRIIPYLNGWFLACHRNVWEDVGGFDLCYGKHDYEDIDLSLTASVKGYSLVEVAGLKIRHLGSQTAPYGSEREAITRQNQKKFIEKWSDVFRGVLK